jgi:hypothetical protein
MKLIVFYIAFVIAGGFADYLLGLFVEYEWGSNVSLIVFLLLYFFFLWVSWPLAHKTSERLQAHCTLTPWSTISTASPPATSNTCQPALAEFNFSIMIFSFAAKLRP